MKIIFIQLFIILSVLSACQFNNRKKVKKQKVVITYLQINDLNKFVFSTEIQDLKGNILERFYFYDNTGLVRRQYKYHYDSRNRKITETTLICSPFHPNDTVIKRNLYNNKSQLFKALTISNSKIETIEDFEYFPSNKLKSIKRNSKNGFIQTGKEEYYYDKNDSINLIIVKNENQEIFSRNEISFQKNKEKITKKTEIDNNDFSKIVSFYSKNKITKIIEYQENFSDSDPKYLVDKITNFYYQNNRLVKKVIVDEPIQSFCSRSDFSKEIKTYTYKYLH